MILGAKISRAGDNGVKTNVVRRRNVCQSTGADTYLEVTMMQTWALYVVPP